MKQPTLEERLEKLYKELQKAQGEDYKIKRVFMEGTPWFSPCIEYSESRSNDTVMCLSEFITGSMTRVLLQGIGELMHEMEIEEFSL